MRGFGVSFAEAAPGVGVLLVEAFEACVDESDVAGGGEEVDVAEPSGDDVDVRVFGYAGAGGAADVHADVHALWFEDVFAEFGGEADEGPEFALLVGVVVGESWSAVAERDEEVASGVGVGVEEDHAAAVGFGRAGADDDEVGRIVVGALPVAFEEAGAVGGGRGGEGLFRGVVVALLASLFGGEVHDPALAPRGVELCGPGGAGVVCRRGAAGAWIVVVRVASWRHPVFLPC